MIGRPGSAAWLMRHELRLLWRRYNLASRKVPVALLVLGVGAFAQLAGLGVAILMQDVTATLHGRLAVANVAVAALCGLMLSHALDVAVAALFERQDLDWILASPVPLRRVLAVRMAGMAVTVAGPWLLVIGPVANALAMLGQPGWLAAYPAVLALALLAAAAGTGLAVRLVAAAGLRRARRIVGGLSLAAGAAMFLSTQAAALMAPGSRGAVWDALSPPPGDMPPGPAWWPARAMLGEPMPLAALLVAAVAVAAATAGSLARRFADGAALAPPQPARAPARPGRGAAGFPPGAFRALLRKELRLICRTPNLLVRVAYQLIYILPAAGVMWRDGQAVAALGLGTVTVFIAGEAARLLILAAAADPAADLAGSAPLPPGWPARAKMAAAVLVTAGIVALPVAGVAVADASLLPGLGAGIGCVVASGLLLGVWRPLPVRRTDLGGRPARLADTDWLGLLVGACWSGAAWLAMAGTPWAAAPAGVALVMLAVLRPRRRATRRPAPAPARVAGERA